MFSKKIRFEAYKLLHARLVYVEKCVQECGSYSNAWNELQSEIGTLRFNMDRIISSKDRESFFYPMPQVSLRD